MIHPSNCQMLTITRTNFKTNCAPQRWSPCPKISQLQTPIPYILIFLNLHDGDGFATDVVTMGGPLERPIEIRTSAIVMEFFLTHARFAVSLQDKMAIILKRSQEETFSAPAEWSTFIKQVNAQDTIEEAMVSLAADTTLEVRRKTLLDDVVSLVSPGVGLNLDAT
jgi:hypothetical protein